MEQDVLQKIRGRKDLEDALRTKLSGGGDINLYSPTYTKDVKQITPFVGAENLGGYMAHRSPENVNINVKSSTLPNVKKTLGHEAEHSQQAETRKWIQEQQKKDPEFKTPSLLGTSIKVSDSRGANQRVEIMKSAQDAYKKYEKKYELGYNFDKNASEFMSDMVGIEATLPAGSSVLDTDIGKDIFNTPEKRRWYLLSSLPNTTKMLESDPSKFQLAIDKGRQALQEFKDKSLYDSYFGAALSAAKKLFGGK